MFLIRLFDKIIIRCVLKKETDEAYSVNIGSKKRFGKRVDLKSASVNLGNLVLEYEVRTQDEASFSVTAKLPISNPRPRLENR